MPELRQYVSFLHGVRIREHIHLLTVPTERPCLHQKNLFSQKQGFPFDGVCASSGDFSALGLFHAPHWKAGCPPKNINVDTPADDLCVEMSVTYPLHTIYSAMSLTHIIVLLLSTVPKVSHSLNHSAVLTAL